MARGKDKNKDQEQNKGATESMRLDKYLKVSRIIKRRTVAGEACDGGRVLINGKEGKPGAQIKVGDKLEVRFGAGCRDLAYALCRYHRPALSYR